MSKHADGPWEVLYTNGYKECRVVTPTPSRTVAILNDDLVGNRNPENARLMAAAPELLEALKNARDILILSGHTTGGAFRDIERAIDKAEGRPYRPSDTCRKCGAILPVEGSCDHCGS